MIAGGLARGKPGRVLHVTDYLCACFLDGEALSPITGLKSKGAADRGRVL